MRRALAVLAAVAMVGLAVIVRDAIDDDSNDGNGQVVVLCARDLLDACNGLEGVTVRSADAAETAGQIAAGQLPPDVDAWVTGGAWIEVLAARAPDSLGDTTALARTPAVVAADVDRSAAIGQLCTGRPLWSCLGEHAGASWATLGGQPGWGTLRTGLPDADSGTGLAVLASAAAGFFGDLSFAANDFTTGDFPGWLSRLSDTDVAADPDPIATLVTQKGRYSAAGGLAARLQQITRPVDHFDVQPAVPVTAVLVGLPGGDRIPGLPAARRALTEAGWDPTYDEPTPILKPGVLAALHTLWTEITR